MQGVITVVGLGSGDPDQLTLGVWRKLQEAKHRYVRTSGHPMMQMLASHGLAYQSFDTVYEQAESFPAVYEEIAARLLDAARQQGEVLYAVPGHPMVAEKTVQLLREQCQQAGIGLQIVGGESFLDQAFTRLGFDPVEGFQLLDAGELQAGLLQPQVHTVITQVYSAMVASDVKLTLMERYPDDLEVIVGHALGVSGEESIVALPLYELDRIEGYGNLSLIYIPRSDDARLRNRSFERLHEIVAILRSPEGCPWDREQTHLSIRKNFIEETYEAIEAIDNDDPDGMREELGDVLLQIMLHSQMEEEVGAFSAYDVIASLNDKLLFRHPHVFGDSIASSSAEALANWEQMKAEEKRRKAERAGTGGSADAGAGSAGNAGGGAGSAGNVGGAGADTGSLGNTGGGTSGDARAGGEPASILSGIPRDLPAIMRAYELQKKASKVGFDWDEASGALSKVAEELEELRAAIAGQGVGDAADAQAAELGDLLFACVNVARFIKADPEWALARTNRKFMGRFQYIEEQLRINGKTFGQTDLIEMDQWWEEAKRLNR